MKRKLTHVIIMIFSVCGFAQEKANPATTTGFSKERLSRIDSFFQDKIDEQKLAGAITLVAKNNKIVHFKSHGYIDIEKKLPMKNEIIIPIASMTKIITSIAVLLLYEEGEFLLNDPIDKYIPELKGLRVIENLHQSLSDSLITNELKTKPTIRDLLRHTSGMVYSGGRTVSDQLYKKAGFRTWDKSLHDFIKKIAEIPLAFQPGEKWRYSYSHEVLGYFVEVISGIPLNQFCKKRIFAPLGMNNTGFFIPQSKSNQLTNLYHYKNEKLQIEDSRHDSTYYQLPNAISGGGGWWSSYGGVVTTVSDFYILTKMLLNYGKSQRKQFLGSENN